MQRPRSSRVWKLIFVVFLSFTLVPVWMLASSSNAFAADCLSTACKLVYQWGGGAAGADETIQYLWPAPVCGTGCQYVQTGAWVKYTGTGTYIYLGPEKTPTDYSYIYGVWKTSGYTRKVLDYVHSVDYKVGVSASYLSSCGCQYIDFGVSVTSGSARLYLANSNATETVWDVIQTGARMAAQSGVSNYGSFDTFAHHWQCGCDGRWYYQTTNGTQISIGNTVNMHHYWYIPASDPGSQGGDTRNYCLSGSPSCP